MGKFSSLTKNNFVETKVANPPAKKEIQPRSIRVGHNKILEISPSSDMSVHIALGPQSGSRNSFNMPQEGSLSLADLMKFRKMIDDLLLDMAEAKATDPIWMVEANTGVQVTSFGPFNTQEKAKEFAKGPFGGEVYNARVEIR